MSWQRKVTDLEILGKDTSDKELLQNTHRTFKTQDKRKLD